MLNLSGNHDDAGPIHVPDTVPRAWAKAGDAVTRVADAVERRPRPGLGRHLRRLRATAPQRLRTGGEAVVQAKLAKTSRELAHESADLAQAVDSLNAVIRANRRSAARGRTRMLGGLALGAALMYHFDAEHGRERREATARRLAVLTRTIR